MAEGTGIHWVWGRGCPGLWGHGDGGGTWAYQRVYSFHRWKDHGELI